MTIHVTYHSYHRSIEREPTFVPWLNSNTWKTLSMYVCAPGPQLCVWIRFATEIFIQFIPFVILNLCFRYAFHGNQRRNAKAVVIKRIHRIRNLAEILSEVIVETDGTCTNIVKRFVDQSKNWNLKWREVSVSVSCQWAYPIYT